MQKVILKHNPYKVISTIQVNGEAPKKDSKLIQFLNQRFQLWVDRIPELLANEYNDKAFDVVFYGTELDYQDFLVAIESAKVAGISITSTKMPAKEFGEKESDIRQLFATIRELPFEELQSPAVEDAFNKAFSEEFEVNVVATMSAGKSTLINALLGKKLMPSKSGPCTATITKIKDDDDGTFKAVSYGDDNVELERFSVLDYKTMKNLNDNPAVSEIHVTGNIPFVSSDEVSLVLIDTPGPDNARDRRHGEVTAKALDQSSKMLVLFIMDGRHLHDDSQDRFLRNIAKSMSAGGKQSRERFLFVISQMDTYDEEDDDIAGETIPDTKAYLEEMGIDNPNIFPVAAELALFIRRYFSTFDETEKQTLLTKLKPTADKLIAQEQLHLEKYPTLVKQCRDRIDAELQEAIINKDYLGQALIHSGIRGIEETIKMYVTKYCRPQKITNVANTFRHHLDSAEAFQKTRKEIASKTEEREQLQIQIDALNKKLSSKDENTAFRRRVAALEIRTELEDSLDSLVEKVQKEYTEFFKDCPDEMEESDAQEFISKFSTLVDEQYGAFQVSVDKLLKKDIRDKGQTLLNEYIERLKAISDEFSTKNLKIDLKAYVQGKLQEIDADIVVDNSLDNRIEKEKKFKWVPEVREYKFIRRLFHLRDPYYIKDVYKEVEDTIQVTFVSKSKLKDSLTSPIEADLQKEKERVLRFAQEETQRIKEYFFERFDEVDAILEAKMDEFRRASASQADADKAIKDATDLLGRLNDVQQELEKILDI